MLGRDHISNAGERWVAGTGRVTRDRQTEAGRKDVYNSPKVWDTSWIGEGQGESSS